MSADLHQPLCFIAHKCHTEGISAAAQPLRLLPRHGHFLLPASRPLHKPIFRTNTALLPFLGRVQVLQLPAARALDTAPANAGANVHSAFAAAGLSDKAIDKVLSSYPHYLRWDFDARLSPSLQLWLEELGPTELSRRLQQWSALLLGNPTKVREVSLWFTSLGATAAKLQQINPWILVRDLSALQRTLAVFKDVAGFSDDQIPKLVSRQTVAFQHEPQRIVRNLQCIARLLEVPVASDKLRSTVLSSKPTLFGMSATLLERRITRFCSLYGSGSDVAERALKAGVYAMSDDLQQAKALKLQSMLHWSQAQLHTILSTSPHLLGYTSDASSPTCRVCNLMASHTVRC